MKTSSHRRNALLLLVAGLLLAVSAWFGAAPPEEEPPTDGPAFPRAEAASAQDEGGDDVAPSRADPATAAEREARAEMLKLPGKLPKLPGAANSGARLRRALAAPGHGHLMVNMETLTRSEVVRKLMRCRGARAMRGFDRIQRETGLNVQRDVRHVGLGLRNNVLAMSGQMGAVRVPDEATSYGQGARIWQLAESSNQRDVPATGAPAASGDEGDSKQPTRSSQKPQHLALVGDDTLLMAESPSQLKAAIDRLEGNAPAETSSAGNGDVQGQLLADDIVALFGQPKQGERPMVASMRKLAERARLRMNVDSDVAMSIDLNAQPNQGEELAKAVRGSVALMRQAARRGGRKEVERLLDRAKVLDAQDGQVGFDLALPGAWILDRFGCDADGNPKQPQQVAPQPAPTP